MDAFPTDALDLTFVGALIHWRGPSPFHFVTMPEGAAAEVKDISPLVTYGWGVVPATVTIGASTWPTALFPKDGGYLVPVQDMYRTAEHLEVGDTVSVRLTIAPR